MKIMVAIKRVIDYAVKIRVKPDKTGVETTNVKMSMNPFCEIALEEALRIRESGLASEVIAVSMGPQQCVDTLRTGLAMGADRGIHVDTRDTLFPLSVAKLLRALIDVEKPQLLILGKQGFLTGHKGPLLPSTDLRLNQPRYATLPNIMKAKSKVIKKFTPEELNVKIKSDLEIVQVTEPPKRKAGVIVSSVDELVDKLKNEARVI